MKKIQLLFLGLVIALGISSCGYHLGTMANSASLSSNNFTYSQKELKGNAQATYVLGFGGLAKKTLVDEAKKDLLAKNPLKDNQTLANITVNWKSSFYVVFWTIKCTVTADIVEFK